MPRTSTERALPAALVVWAALVALRFLAPAPPAAPLAGDALPLALGTLGVPERGATLAWWQVGRTWASGAPVAPEALAASVRRTGELDPTWRTPWIYGGLMLQALEVPGADAEAEALLSEGAGRWPGDPWFPAALGVHLQDQGRVDEARRWLRTARERS